ncbi:hypothetical protein PRIPAC_95743 [Pristionchus pacificus]|uniref:Uncharacterized protein n=1 Tax=Pristionchus pacificus TaxID=54126 RepID=A0A2A6BCX0_PRIPA|nr:hypothetical protein PRIPAC_95743 [Pristionchus pacificus]|eukprot:PDM63681.1 hypothetical protein PRIPAC_49654 [Pristionchus pacificus]
MSDNLGNAGKKSDKGKGSEDDAKECQKERVEADAPTASSGSDSTASDPSARTPSSPTISTAESELATACSPGRWPIVRQLDIAVDSEGVTRTLVEWKDANFAPSWIRSENLRYSTNNHTREALETLITSQLLITPYRQYHPDIVALLNSLGIHVDIIRQAAVDINYKPGRGSYRAPKKPLKPLTDAELLAARMKRNARIFDKQWKEFLRDHPDLEQPRKTSNPRPALKAPKCAQKGAPKGTQKGAHKGMKEEDHESMKGKRSIRKKTPQPSSGNMGPVTPPLPRRHIAQGTSGRGMESMKGGKKPAEKKDKCCKGDDQKMGLVTPPLPRRHIAQGTSGRGMESMKGGKKPAEKKDKCCKGDDQKMGPVTPPLPRRHIAQGTSGRGMESMKGGKKPAEKKDKCCKGDDEKMGLVTPPLPRRHIAQGTSGRGMESMKGGKKPAEKKDKCCKGDDEKPTVRDRRRHPIGTSPDGGQSGARGRDKEDKCCKEGDNKGDRAKKDEKSTKNTKGEKDKDNKGHKKQ